MISIERAEATPGIATVELAHGKVNALTLQLVRRLDGALTELEHDDSVSAVVLTGRGAFFSFGFDVPHFLGESREHFTEFLHAFTGLYTRLFVLPKPLVAAVNGHAVAGGWMLAQACDARVMARGRFKHGLNEVRFGAALFAGSLEILRHVGGGRVADRVAGSGIFFDPDEALALGLADDLCERDELTARSAAFVRERYGDVTQPSFATIKRLQRGAIVDGYRDREAASIERFLEIWYTDEVQAAVTKIVIR